MARASSLRPVLARAVSYTHLDVYKRQEQLAHIGQVDMLPGDIFEIHTPGGGGYGQPH